MNGVYVLLERNFDNFAAVQGYVNCGKLLQYLFLLSCNFICVLTKSHKYRPIFNYQSTFLEQATHSIYVLHVLSLTKLISPSKQTTVLLYFKRVRKTAKSGYYLCRVCLCARPSVRMEQLYSLFFFF